MSLELQSTGLVSIFLAQILYICYGAGLAAQSSPPIANVTGIDSASARWVPGEAMPRISLAADGSGHGLSTTIDALLEQMSLSAGAIFVGQVSAIRRTSPLDGSAVRGGVVEIDLRVGQSILGPVSGATYTLREWSGLWEFNSDRYRVGQRMLLFLRTPSSNGLSAPVHGFEGAIPLRGGGIAPGPNDSTTTAAEWMVDVRWLQAQVLNRRFPSALLGPSPSGNPPVHRFIPERGSPTTPRSDPSLVSAMPMPWNIPSPTYVDVRPLSEVLSLCSKVLTREAARSRDDSR